MNPVLNYTELLDCNNKPHLKIDVMVREGFVDRRQHFLSHLKIKRKFRKTFLCILKT